jgi:hypothetical protein
MKKFEIMVAISTTIQENDRDAAVMALSDSINIDGNASLYDVDIYDVKGQGDFIGKVTLTSTDSDIESFSINNLISFEHHEIINAKIEQIAPAYS